MKSIRGVRKEAFRRAWGELVFALLLTVLAAWFSSAGEKTWATSVAIIAAVSLIEAVVLTLKTLDRAANDPVWTLIVSGPGEHMLALREYEKVVERKGMPVRLEVPAKVTSTKAVWLDALHRCDDVSFALASLPGEAVVFLVGAAYDMNKKVRFTGSWSPEDPVAFFLVAKDRYRSAT